MSQQKIKLDFYIKHPTRDLSSVSVVLGMRPDIIWKQGDEARTPKGNKLGRLREESRCMFRLVNSTESLSKQIEGALSLLKPHRAVLHELSSTGGQIGLSVGWFCDKTDGEEFDWELLSAMADLRVTLQLFIYMPDKQELENEAK